jgi:CcmD family protein
MNGLIEGGWIYIYGAYGVTWVLLSGYTISLIVRSRTIPPEDSL